jgi:hypothetical protein
MKPAAAVLSTGSVGFPLNRPVCGLYTHKVSRGKLVVLGSTHMFSDQYLDKEENAKILVWFSHDGFNVRVPNNICNLICMCEATGLYIM